MIAWIEWSLTALFSRASVRFVADATDRNRIGSTIVSFHLVLAVIAALLLAALATPLSAILGTRELAGPLRLFAADIPPFCLAQAHRDEAERQQRDEPPGSRGCRPAPPLAARGPERRDEAARFRPPLTCRIVATTNT